MNPKRDLGTSLIILENAEILKQLWAAKINKVNSRSDEVNESESARAVTREMLWSSRGSIRSMRDF